MITKMKGFIKMKYNTLIFDLDGTLLNTIEDLTDSLNYALEQNNLPTYTVDNVKFFVGSGIKIMIERALKNNMVKFESVYNDFLAHYSKNNTNKTALYPGVLETIKKLKTMNVKMAIVSNKYQQGVIDICKPLLGEYIDVMVGEQPGLSKKPNADMVNYALEKLQVDKETAAYVGDSDIDYLTAKNSALDFIGAAWGFRGRVFLENLKSKYVANSFEDILDIIQ